MSFHIGDSVVVLRDIYRLSDKPNRSYCLYARQGELGTVTKIFDSWHGGSEKVKHASIVIIESAGTIRRSKQIGKIKTFRLTSLGEVRHSIQKQIRRKHLSRQVRKLPRANVGTKGSVHSR